MVFDALTLEQVLSIKLYKEAVDLRDVSLIRYKKFTIS